MLDIQQKRKVRSFMYSRITLAILFVIVILAMHSTWGVYRKKGESEELKSVALANVEELRQKNTELEAKIERLDTTVGIEEEIRSKFSVAKENERVVVVIEDEVEATTTPEKDSFWKKIKKFFTE